MRIVDIARAGGIDRDAPTAAAVSVDQARAGRQRSPIAAILGTPPYHFAVRGVESLEHVVGGHHELLFALSVHQHRAAVGAATLFRALSLPLERAGVFVQSQEERFLPLIHEDKKVILKQEW